MYKSFVYVLVHILYVHNSSKTQARILAQQTKTIRAL